MTPRRLAAAAAALLLLVVGAFAAIAALTGDSSPSGAPAPAPAAASAEPSAAAAPAPAGPLQPSVPLAKPAPAVDLSARSSAPAATTGKPVFSRLEPTSGPAAGGGQVVIRGSNLAGVAQVLFGSTPARIAARADDRLTIDVPASAPGVATLVLTASDGSYAVAPGAYSYR